MRERDRSGTAHAVRLFESDFLEWFSHVRPMTVAAFWGPFSLALLVAGLSLRRFAAIEVLGLFLAVAVIWGVFEYLFHRFLFHAIDGLPGGKRLSFVLHGCHHADPMDATRNVMPPVVTIPVFGAFFAAFLVFLPLPVCLVLFGFFGFAYLTYDMTHYACHQARMTGPVGRLLKRHHLLHHYADGTRNFSVTLPIWDRVFGTYRRG